MKGFTVKEEAMVYVIARIALADADTFDYMVENSNFSDNEMKMLQEKLETVTTTTKG